MNGSVTTTGVATGLREAGGFLKLNASKIVRQESAMVGRGPNWASNRDAASLDTAEAVR